MSAARAKGTAWESAIVEYLRDNGVPYAERRALGGAYDRGDIAGVPGVVIEAKSASRVDLAGWVAEAETERANDGAAHGVVWAKRARKSGAGEGYVIMTGAGLVKLLAEAGYIAGSPSAAPARADGDPLLASLRDLVRQYEPGRTDEAALHHTAVSMDGAELIDCAATN